MFDQIFQMFAYGYGTGLALVVVAVYLRFREGR